MTLYNVHLYRELRLFFPRIEASTPEDAAGIAADKLTEEAEYTDDECDGQNLAALVDVAGDHEYRHSVTIDFEAERLRKAVPDLLDAIEACIGQIHALLPPYHQTDSTLDNLPAVLKARAAYARATGGSLHAEGRSA